MKACPICQKTSQAASGYSNRVRATKYNPTVKYRKQPNLQWAPLPEGGRIKICTKCQKAGKHLRLVRVK
jgi:hypothetical protein